jgi:UDP-N-acetylmuramoylalanine--D-glutamate ligase
LRLDVGVLLNISEDHLDWHVSMTSYRQAKQNIYRCACVAVLNADDLYYQPDALQTKLLDFLDSKPCIYFGLASPNDWQHWGLLESVSESEQRVRYLACQRNGSVEPIVPVEALKIRGLHNVSNALAVMALCQAIGVVSTHDDLINAVASYRGQAHRVEWVNQISGVDFFDDSKGTNVGATQAALMGLAGEGYALFVIVGGDGKGQDFAPLATDLLRHAKAVFLIGRDASLIKVAIDEAIEKHRTDQTLAVLKSLELAQAVTQAFDAALWFKLKNPTQKVAVLLSPACASLDHFKNYAHRAQVFCDRVAELADEFDLKK